MLSFMFLGLLVGMAHALEADHLAAVGTLVGRGTGGRRRMAGLGLSWGLGHTTMLALFSLPMVLLGYVVTARVEAGLEFAVGVMLVGLGLGVIVKLRRQKVHFHLHEHDDGQRHFHAHSHTSTPVPHDEDSHDHGHLRLFSKKSYLVGLAHGAAGSAALVAVAAAATQNWATTLLYIVVFGLGSTLGMAILTLVASWPLERAEAGAGRFHDLIKTSLACASVLVGASVMVATYSLMLGAPG